jgi:hypothetical protein
MFSSSTGKKRKKYIHRYAMGTLEDNMVMLYDVINRNEKTGLSCFEITDNPWGVIICRRKLDWQHSWLQLGRQLYADQNPLICKKYKSCLDNIPSHALLLYPENDLDESSGCYRIFPLYEGKQLLQESITRMDLFSSSSKGKMVSRFHRLLSHLQYPFLSQIRRRRCWIQEFRKRRMLQNELIPASDHPMRLSYALKNGGSIDEWCSRHE